MNKTLALVALLGLVSAPAFASEEKAAAPAAKPAAEKMVKVETTEMKKEEVKVVEDCSKAADKAACEAKEAAAKAAAEKAPAAGKAEEKKAH